MIVARNITLDDIEKEIWEEARTEIEKELEDLNEDVHYMDGIYTNYYIATRAYNKLRQAIIDGRV